MGPLQLNVLLSGGAGRKKWAPVGVMGKDVSSPRHLGVSSFPPSPSHHGTTHINPETSETSPPLSCRCPVLRPTAKKVTETQAQHLLVF